MTPSILDERPSGVRSPLWRYPFALAALAAAVLLRLWLDPVIGDALPFVTLFGAVAAAVWVGGYRPAIMVSVLGYVAVAYLFIPPRGSLGLDTNHPADVVGLLAYLSTCAVIIAFGEGLRMAQQRSSERRELLRITLGSIGDAVITTDTDGHITYLNAVAETLTGWTRADATGRPLDLVFRVINEHTRRPIESPAMRALHEGVVVGLANDTVLLQKDGGERPIDDSAAPIRDEHGQVSGCVLIFRDVTSHRRAERDKAAQLLIARRLASIIESSDDAIIGKSLDGIIQNWNAAAERLFGYSSQQAVGRHISLIIPPERIAEEDLIISRLKAGERIDHFETERRRADGTLLLVSLTISPVRDDTGTVVGASKIVRDVTRQRQAELRERQLLAEAAAANAKFEAFFEQGAVFAGIIQVDGIILEVNRLSWEGCGYAREQVVGMPFWDGPWWAPSPASVAQIKAGSAQAAAGQTFRAELAYFVADGGERVADVIIQPILDENRRVLFLAPTWTNITDRKRLEDNLRALASDLSEADRRKNEFLAMLAHELRNPLAPISNAVHALRLGATSAAAVQSASDMLERQVGQMARLVDDLLDVSRITRGTIELRPERVELSPVVTQAVDAARPAFRSLNHELTVALPEQPIYLMVDPARLAQVVGNLLNNANKFTDRDGRVWLTVERAGSQAVVRVRDNGIGIAPDQLPRLFDIFTQVDTSLERSRDGLGIGLTLVKTLVEAQGGSVEAHSEGLGRGSEFVVRMPIAPETPMKPVSATATAPAPAARRRILIVDDNRDGAESLAMLLSIAGHEPHVAFDGQAGIDAAERLLPDAVLLDIGLPGLNGYEVCRRIRQEPWGRELMLIALTGWGQDEDRARSKEAGFDRHLVKPVDPAGLMTLLASIPSRGDRDVTPSS